ncbi:MAG TPA: hypothetical protein VMD59_14960 [Acidimicrobiales bacterium]|nr:hypothetical protein [Acidimicrobiales bacterium]
MQSWPAPSIEPTERVPRPDSWPTTSEQPVERVPRTLSWPSPPSPPKPAELTSWPEPAWDAPASGHIYMSSPTTARIGDEDVIAVGTEAGEVELLDAATGAELPGWPRRVAAEPGQPAAVESSPAIAWLDGAGAPPSIIVGTGSTSVNHGHTVGEVEAFNLNGTERFVFRVPSIGPGTAEGVISSPGVGDVTGDGQLDVVFGSWDHELYALTPEGTLVPGFPVDNLDTIWSSPALYHVRGPASLDDIFIGSDASGRDGCFGGFITDYSYAGGKPFIVWQHCEPQTIWSSPAIGLINSTGRPVVVVGTGFGETTYAAGSSELLAFYADDGSTVRGWPVATPGPTPGSPAIGIGPGGRPMIVATSWNCNGTDEKSCFYANDSTVIELTGSGRIVGTAVLAGATALSSPVLVPLRGERTDDILVGAASGLYAISAKPVHAISAKPVHAHGAHDVGTLPFLYGITPGDTIGPDCPVNNSPALVDLPGSGSGSGWHVIDACGGPVALNLRAEVMSYRLPVQPKSYEAIWPEFHDMPEHEGVAGDPAPGDPVPAALATAPRCVAGTCARSDPFARPASVIEAERALAKRAVTGRSASSG